MFSNPLVSLRSAGFAGVVFFAAGSAFAAQAPVVDITGSGAKVRGAPTLDERVGKIERILENETLENFAARIEELQNQMQRIQGEMEVLTHGMEDLRRKQNELYMDIDRRLRAIEAGSASATPPANNDAPGAIGAPPVNQEARSAYEAAFGLLREGKYDAAITGLREFVKTYPNSEYAPNAQYWLGEALFTQRRFDTALAEFEKVVTRYPTSSKFPDALLRVGLTHYELGVWDKSKKALEEVVAKFPNTSQAQSATQRLEKLRAEGH